MQRVVILGNSGVGKSTFARALGEKLGLPVVHLDALFWRPGWTDPDPQEFRDAVAAAVARERWVTEGNFVGRTFDLRLPRADTVIYIEQPDWLCLYRVIWRWLTAFGRARPDLAPGCRERFDPTFMLWVWNFRRQTQPRVMEAVSRYPTPITVQHGDAGMARFLAEAR
jgi:adenylate kinase family enzyme